jgi:hypothetical protein
MMTEIDEQGIEMNTLRNSDIGESVTLSLEEYETFKKMESHYKKFVESTRPGRGVVNSIPLMHQLSRMAGIPLALAEEMTLVLHIDETPHLYVKTQLQEPREGENEEDLISSPLNVTYVETPISL